MSTSDSEQCHALVGDGERCSRPAQADGFCYQHDESDETIDDASAADSAYADGGSSTDSDGGSSTDSDGGSSTDSDGGSSTDDSTSSETAVNTDGSIDMDDADVESDRSDEGDAGSDTAATPLQKARASAQEIGWEMIGAEPDGVIGVTSTDGGWQVTLEVVERPAVPDTQDILGRYEIDLDSNFAATGYRRLDRYRRSDTERDEVIE